MKQHSALVLLLTAAAFAHSTTGQDNVTNTTPQQPTLKETTAWLETHLVGLSRKSKVTTNYKATKKYHPKDADRQTSTFSNVVLEAGFNQCLLNIHEQSYVNDSVSSETFTSISLDRMTQASWKSQTQPGENTDKLSTTFDPDTYVEVRMNGLPASAKWRMVSIPADDTDPPKAGSDDWYSFATDDKDIAPRLVKALNHAIELCHAGAKPEPF
jgi:hypothetical protein